MVGDADCCAIPLGEAGVGKFGGSAPRGSLPCVKAASASGGEFPGKLGFVEGGLGASRNVFRDCRSEFSSTPTRRRRLSSLTSAGHSLTLCTSIGTRKPLRPRGSCQ